jgi:carbon monoxide dehydrogenase subunit G
MTIRVERTFELPVARERVWEFIADPEKRATPISVVTDFEVEDERNHIWHVKLPIPVINRTIAVKTEEVETRPPEYVKFIGRSKVMRVVGEHTLTETDEGTNLHNQFTVEGKLPGVERFFKRNLDAELDNLETALRLDLELEA